MHTWASWAETLVRAANDAGVSATLPLALLEALDRTIELGHGDKDFPVVYEAYRPITALTN